MLRPTPLADLPPFSDTAAAAIRRQLAARRLCDFWVDATGRLEAGRLRPLAAPFLPTEFLPGCCPPKTISTPTRRYIYIMSANTGSELNVVVKQGDVVLGEDNLTPAGAGPTKAPATAVMKRADPYIQPADISAWQCRRASNQVDSIAGCCACALSCGLTRAQGMANDAHFEFTICVWDIGLPDALCTPWLGLCCGCCCCVWSSWAKFMHGLMGFDVDTEHKISDGYERFGFNCCCTDQS